MNKKTASDKTIAEAEAIAERKEKRLTLWGHLEELRRRLLHTAIAVVLGMGLGFYLTPTILHFLLRPMTMWGIKPIFVDITEYIGVYFNMALMSGFVFALPVVFYEVIMFLLPGLSRRERLYLYILLPCISILFASGFFFSNFVLLPPAMHFLTSFGSDIAQPQIRIGTYISAVTRLMFWTGIVFETPLVMAFITKLGLVNYRGFMRWWRWVFILAFVLGGIITPTIDPVNQTLFSAPIIVLYGVGILVSWVIARPKKAKAA